jgi:prepilin-type N-terminal cleavage/methylation domain-containing protein
LRKEKTMVGMTRNCRIYGKTKHGFTLTEVAIVLGIVGLILGAVWVAARGVNTGVNANKAAQVTSTLIATVRGAFGGTSNYPTDGSDLSGMSAGTAYTLANGTTTTPKIEVYNPGGGVTPSFIVYFGTNGAPSAGSDSGLCRGVAQAAYAAGGAAFNNRGLARTPPTTGTCNTGNGTCGGCAGGMVAVNDGTCSVGGTNTGCTCVPQPPTACGSTFAARIPFPFQ